MTALRETALAAIVARLAGAIPAATVERARRAPVDIDKESLPRLVVTGTDWSADEAAEPLAVHYTLSFAVAGTLRAAVPKGADGGMQIDQALSALHDAVVDALSGWTPGIDGLGDPAQEGAEFRVLDAEESAGPAGEFTARFSMLCLGPLIAA
jgi:hypothetical protein